MSRSSRQASLLIFSYTMLAVAWGWRLLANDPATPKENPLLDTTRTAIASSLAHVPKHLQQPAVFQLAMLPDRELEALHTWLKAAPEQRLRQLTVQQGPLHTPCPLNTALLFVELTRADAPLIDDSRLLVSASGDRRFPLTGRTGFVVGRELSCTVPILDPSVSRRHAELRVTASGTVEVHDLTSRNGTWVNGVRVQRATVVPGDTLAFATVAFTLRHDDDGGSPEADTSANALASPLASASPMAAFDGSATMRFERRVPSREQSLADVAHVAAGHAQATARLAQLVGIAQHLGGFTDLDALL